MEKKNLSNLLQTFVCLVEEHKEGFPRHVMHYFTLYLQVNALSLVNYRDLPARLR